MDYSKSSISILRKEFACLCDTSFVNEPQFTIDEIWKAFGKMNEVKRTLHKTMVKFDYYSYEKCYHKYKQFAES